MTDDPQMSLLATAVRAAGTALVAVLLLALSRFTPGRFLRPWAAAWLCRAGGLGALLLAAHGPADLRRPFLSAALLAGYLFAGLLWAGLHHLTDARWPPARRLAWLVAPAGYALLAPGLPPGWLLAGHAAVLVGLFAVALRPATGWLADGGPVLGQWLVRGGLAGLAAHAAAVLVLAAGGDPRGEEAGRLVGLAGLLTETVLAFGMVVLAADRTRGLLEAQNRALAAAAGELALAARLDPLTGVGNRRRFEQVLQAHAADPGPGAVAVLDLNDLKRLNDAHGHPAGDAALKLVARAVRGRVRITDPVCRTGGDEFVVLMPGAAPDELAGRLAGLDRELAGQRLPGAGGATDLWLAWGVAGYGDDLPAAVAAADRAMYARKRQMKAPAPAESPA